MRGLDLFKKKLIIIPAYNESTNLVHVVEDIEKNAPDFDYVIINDCSKDDTEQICKDNNFNYVSLPINLGIGGGMQTGYKYAQRYGYDIAVQFDGDGQHDAAYLGIFFRRWRRSRLIWLSVHALLIKRVFNLLSQED